MTNKVQTEDQPLRYEQCVNSAVRAKLFPERAVSVRVCLVTRDKFLQFANGVEFKFAGNSNEEKDRGQEY